MTAAMPALACEADDGLLGVWPTCSKIKQQRLHAPALRLQGLIWRIRLGMQLLAAMQHE